MTTLTVLLLGDPGSDDLKLAAATIANLFPEQLDDPARLPSRLQSRAWDPYDVCIIDQTFGPGLAAIIETLRRLSPHSVIVVLTNGDDPGTPAAGATQYYLTKPLRASALQWVFQRLELERLLQHERALAAFVKTAEHARTKDHVAQLIVQHGCDLGFRRARLYRYEKNARLLGELVGVALSSNHSMTTEQFRSIRDPFDPIGNHAYLRRVLEAGELSVFPEREPGKTYIDKILGQYGVQPPAGPWVELPLRLDHDLWGVLTLDYDQQEPDWHVVHTCRPALRYFGRLASIALERAQEKEDVLIREARTVSTSIVPNLGVESTVREVLFELDGLFKDLRASPFVLIYKPEQACLHFTEASLQRFYIITEETERQRKCVWLHETSLVGDAARESLRTGVAAHRRVSNVRADGVPYLPLIKTTASELCLTLMSQEGLLGAIALESPEPDAFTEMHAEVLALVASPISEAIQRASSNGFTKTVWQRGSSAALVRCLGIHSPDQPVPDDTATHILEKLFPQARRLEVLDIQPFGPLEHGDATVEQTRLHDMFRLKVRPDDEPAVIVKLGSTEAIVAEISNYSRFIIKEKDTFGPLIAPPELGREAFAHFRGIAKIDSLAGATYGFDETPVGNLMRFADFYSTNLADVIVPSLQLFFSRSWHANYLLTIKPDDRSLFAQYGEVWDNSLWARRLQRYADRPEPGDANVLRERGVPDPVAWLTQQLRNGQSDVKRSRLPGTWRAVTYGDLRSGTLFVDGPSNNAIRISDYRRTGPGPVLQDFVELEVDILLRLTYAGNQDLDTIFDVLTDATRTARIPDRIIKLSAEHITEDAEITKARSVLSALRLAAFDLTGVLDIRQYLWGVLFNAVYAALLLRDRGELPAVRTRALLLGGLVCHRLDELQAAELTQTNVSVLISGSLINSILNMNNTFSDVQQHIGAPSSADATATLLLRQLVAVLGELRQAAPPEQAADAETTVRLASRIVAVATHDAPDRRQIDRDVDQLKQAAARCADVLPGIPSITMLLLTTIEWLLERSGATG